MKGKMLWILLAGAALVSADLAAQEARRRWEMMSQIRRDKFDYVLPKAMRDNQIDMWITVVKEGLPDPLTPDLGEGYVSSIGYYIFSDRGGERIERGAFGIDGYFIEESGAYDIIESRVDLRAFVAERDPKRIAVNMSERIGAADGLSHTSYRHLVETLGEPYSTRLVSAQKLISDFRSQRVASEIAAFAEAGEISRRIAETALSNQVITPGKTMLEDVSWWMQEQLFARGLGSSFGMPSVYVTGPRGIEDLSNRRIIQRGDYLTIDWGVGLMNFHTDVKRIAYVLREGETAAPAGIQNAFDQAKKARDVVRRNIRPGKTAEETLAYVNGKLEEAGFAVMEEFNKPKGLDQTEVIIGCHSVGNLGHDVGPSIAFFNPLRLTFMIQPTNMFSIELFAYTKAPEWGGTQVRVALEDNAIVTDRGVEWLYPINDRILLIR